METVLVDSGLECLSTDVFTRRAAA